MCYVDFNASNANNGAFNSNLNNSASNTNTNIGFRLAKIKTWQNAAVTCFRVSPLIFGGVRPSWVRQENVYCGARAGDTTPVLAHVLEE